MPRARRADRPRGPDGSRRGTVVPARAGIVAQQFVDRLVSSAPSVRLRDRGLVDHVHRCRFGETLSRAVAAAGHHLRALPSPECDGDRSVGDAALESRFEEHRAARSVRGDEPRRVVTLVNADCSAGTNKSRRGDAHAVITVDREHSCARDRLGQTHAGARGGTSRSRSVTTTAVGTSTSPIHSCDENRPSAPAASVIAAGSLRLNSSSTHSRPGNCGIRLAIIWLMTRAPRRRRRGAHARSDERQQRPQADLALGCRGSCATSRTRPSR